MDGFPDNGDTPDSLPEDERPPGSAGPVTGRWNRNAMRLHCLDRHKQSINAVFLVLSASKVGLKELWRLKWHRKFDTSGYQGGWSEWMQKYKDY